MGQEEREKVLQEAKEKVKTLLNVLDMKLPEPAINMGLIQLIKELPEFQDYVIKGNYSRIATSVYGASKDDIVIYKNSTDPTAGVLVMPEENDETTDEATGGDLEGFTQQLESLGLEPSSGTDLDISVTELKIIAEDRHKYQLFAESLKVASELLWTNTSNGIIVDKITIYGLLTNLTLNDAKPYRIVLDFCTGKYDVKEGQSSINFNTCLKRIHALLEK